MRGTPSVESAELIICKVMIGIAGARLIALPARFTRSLEPQGGAVPLNAVAATITESLSII